MREQGYYWVRYNGEWEINYFERKGDSGGWITSKDSDIAARWDDVIYDEIDEKRIKRHRYT